MYLSYWEIEKYRKFVRKSLVAKIDIKKGEKFSVKIHQLKDQAKVSIQWKLKNI